MKKQPSPKMPTHGPRLSGMPGVTAGSRMLLPLIAALTVMLTGLAPAMSAVGILPTNNQITAVDNNGKWNNPATWDLNRVPAPGDNVVIPAGIKVKYDKYQMPASSAPIRSVRIDGELSFVPWWSARLVVDTIVVSDTGKLKIASENRPMDSRWKVVEIIFDGGDLDLSLDPNLQGRGLLSHGTVEAYGYGRTPYVKLADGSGAISADGLTITLDSVPTNWHSGDTLLVTGDERVKQVRNVEYTLDTYTTKDEVVEIDSISGNVVTLETPLTAGFHDRPFPGMPILVANMTRNIRFSTSADNADTTHRRAHAMFMSENTYLDGVSFTDMGRSDKNHPLTNIGSSVTANMKGRYPVHFHQIGQEKETPAEIHNSVVHNSPGWGIAVHSSHAVVEDNVTYEIFASHFVAEEGDERGSMRRNLAVKSVGDDDRGIKTFKTTDSDGTKFQDDGQLGHGYWFQSRNMAVEDNYAVSHPDEGFVYFHRNVNKVDIPIENQLTEHRDILAAEGRTHLDRDATPIVVSNRNIAVGCSKAMHVIKAQPGQGHDIRNMFIGWKGFEVNTGVEVQYTGEYTFRDFEMYNSGTNGKYSAAFLHGNRVIDMVHVNFIADGWARTFIASETFPAGDGTFSGFGNGDDVGNILFVDGQVRQNGETSFSPFDLATHMWKDEHENNNGGTRWYVPTVHESVAYNSNMDIGSSYVLPAPVMDYLSIAVQGIPAAEWSSVKLFATGVKTDSAGVMSRDPNWEDTFSFEKIWRGGALRNIVSDEKYTVNGKEYIDLLDHAGDRVNGNVVPFTYTVELTPYQ